MNITEIKIPDRAAEGSQVNVTVTVQNRYTVYTISWAVTGRYNTTELTFSPGWTYLPPNGVQSFSSRFIMPPRPVRVEVWSWYYIHEVGRVYQDDYEYRDVALLITAPEFRNLSIAQFVKV